MSVNKIVIAEKQQLRESILGNVDLNPPTELMKYDEFLQRFNFLEKLNPTHANTVNSVLNTLHMTNQIAMANSLLTAFNSLPEHFANLGKLVDLDPTLTYQASIVKGVLFVYPSTKSLPTDTFSGVFTSATSLNGGGNSYPIAVTYVNNQMVITSTSNNTVLKFPTIYLDKNNRLRFIDTNYLSGLCYFIVNPSNF